MKKKVLLSLTALLVVAIALFIIYPANSPPASQAFINATVVSVNTEQPLAEAVFVRGERISAVGSNSDIQALIEADTQVHDLQGQTLVPGFIDAHGHFPGSGLTELSVDLNSPPIGNITDMQGLLTALQAQAANTPKGEWILGIGYDDTLLTEQRHPHREELDRALPDHPVFLMHISGHMGVVNSAGMEVAGIDEISEAPKGGHYGRDASSNLLNGLLEENAAMESQRLAMDFSVLDFFQMIRSASAEYARAGVTTAQSGATDSSVAQGLVLASRLQMVPMRLELWPLFDKLGPELLDGSKSADSFESPLVNLGAIKVIADGSIQGYTGYLSHPYHKPFHGDAEYRGYPRIPKQELLDWVEQYHCGGFQLAIHGNGDASIDDILAAFTSAQQKCPRQDSRHIVVHSQMARPDQLDTMKTLGVTPSFFVAHTFYWGDRHRDIFMGPERASQMSPTSAAADRGLRFSIHLDTPVVPMDPLFLIWTAVNHLSSSGQVIGPEQRISPLAALRATTIDAAWQIFQEDNRGSIEVGKYADLVVLSANPLDNPETIKDLQVKRTVVGGRTIYPEQ